MSIADKTVATTYATTNTHANNSHPFMAFSKTQVLGARHFYMTAACPGVSGLFGP